MTPSTTVLAPDQDRPTTADPWPRILFVAGGILLATMLVHAAALALGHGPLLGPVSLRKPLTFAETGWLTAWSVALIMPTVALKPWERHVVGGATLLFGVGETAVIGIQAWRGVPSHYNFSTLFDAVLMRAGAAGFAMIFLAGMILLLVATFRPVGAPPSVLLGLRIGIVVLLFGCAIGLVMISNMSGVFQGALGTAFTRPQVGYLGPSPEQIGQEYLLLRPYTAGGDLVLLHAIGVHGLPMIVVPALLLARTATTERSRTRHALAIGGSVVVAIVVLSVHSFRSLPLAELGPAPLLLLALCAVVLLAAYTSVGVTLIRTWRHRRDRVLR